MMEVSLAHAEMLPISPVPSVSHPQSGQLLKVPGLLRGDRSLVCLFYSAMWISLLQGLRLGPGGAAWLGPLPPLGLFTLGCQQQYLFGEMPPFGISYFLFGKRAQGLSRVKKAKRGEAAHNSCPFASD